MAGKPRRDIDRRKFIADLTGAGAITAATLLSTRKALRAQPRAPRINVSPPRPARDRLEEALARIADPKGEGARACLTVYTNAARDAANAADARARAGLSLGPLDGAIISIKDLFDVGGEPTRAGSKILADTPPASADAVVVRRLRAAGSVIVAKTNMAEFAFSILGLNPHYGTPGNPADRRRVPGGSSSGAAVAVADGMCEIGIGSDTGGSTRAPAAFCGLVGFKLANIGCRPRARSRYPTTLDPVGPIARSVGACAVADAAAWPVTNPGRSNPNPFRDCGSALPKACRSPVSNKRSGREFFRWDECARWSCRRAPFRRKIFLSLDDMTRGERQGEDLDHRGLRDPSRAARRPPPRITIPMCALGSKPCVDFPPPIILQ